MDLIVQFDDLFSIGRDGSRVTIRFNKNGFWHGYGIHWNRAEELAMELKSRIPADDGTDQKCVPVDFSVIPDKTYVLRKPMAHELYRALIIKAREAEEQDKAAQIAFDAAILLRAGANFGLTSDPRIQEEAKKESAWNSDLRRYMPGGVKSREIFGTPTVLAHPPEVKP